jgi:hypothetical protein
VVAIILKQHLQNNLPVLEILEKKLHTSLNKAPLSLGSLRLIEKYLQGFCKKYPPERIPDWENPTDANDEYHGYNHDDYQTWKHSWE